MSELRPVEPLDPKRHLVSEFRCGQPSLDRWLQSYAGQSQRRDVARTFVAAEPDAKVSPTTPWLPARWNTPAPLLP